ITKWKNHEMFGLQPKKISKDYEDGATKAVVEQIMKIATTSKDPAFQILAIRSIASLARMFPGKV
ncbi:hypothetical protein AKJ16_DCAP17594, partial [Drosera capensis]